MHSSCTDFKLKNVSQLLIYLVKSWKLDIQQNTSQKKEENVRKAQIGVHTNYGAHCVLEYMKWNEMRLQFGRQIARANCMIPSKFRSHRREMHFSLSHDDSNAMVFCLLYICLWFFVSGEKPISKLYTNPIVSCSFTLWIWHLEFHLIRLLWNRWPGIFSISPNKFVSSSFRLFRQSKWLLEWLHQYSKKHQTLSIDLPRS